MHAYLIVLWMCSEHFSHRVSVKLLTIVISLAQRRNGRILERFSHDFFICVHQPWCRYHIWRICVVSVMPNVTACDTGTNVLNNFGHEPAEDYLQTYFILIISRMNPGWLVRIVYLFSQSIVMYVYIDQKPGTWWVTALFIDTDWC